MTGAYSFGIEEEYFLVDAQTKAVARAMPEGFLKQAKDATGGQVMGEFLQSQCEVAPVPHCAIRPPLAELRHLRQTVAKIAAEHGACHHCRRHAPDRRLGPLPAEQKASATTR